MLSIMHLNKVFSFKFKSIVEQANDILHSLHFRFALIASFFWWSTVRQFYYFVGSTDFLIVIVYILCLSITNDAFFGVTNHMTNFLYGVLTN